MGATVLLPIAYLCSPFQCTSQFHMPFHVWIGHLRTNLARLVKAMLGLLPNHDLDRLRSVNMTAFPC